MAEERNRCESSRSSTEVAAQLKCERAEPIGSKANAGAGHFAGHATYVTLESAPQSHAHAHHQPRPAQQQRPTQLVDSDPQRHGDYESPLAADANGADASSVSSSTASAEYHHPQPHHHHHQLHHHHHSSPAFAAVSDNYLHFRNGHQGYAYYGHDAVANADEDDGDASRHKNHSSDNDNDVPPPPPPSVEAPYGKGSNFVAEKLYATVLSGTFDEPPNSAANEQVNQPSPIARI